MASRTGNPPAIGWINGDQSDKQGGQGFGCRLQCGMVSVRKQQQTALEYGAVIYNNNQLKGLDVSCGGTNTCPAFKSSAYIS